MLLLELGQRQRLPDGQRMAGGQHGDDVVRTVFGEMVLPHGVPAQPLEGQIVVAVLQQPRDVASFHLGDLHADGRMLLLEGQDRFGDFIGLDDRNGGDADGLAADGLAAVHAVHAVMVGLDDLHGGGQQELAAFGQRHMVRGTVEQLASQLVLHGGDVLGKGGLGDEKIVCGIRKIQPSGDNREFHQVADFHAFCLRLSVIPSWNKR